MFGSIPRIAYFTLFLLLTFISFNDSQAERRCRGGNCFVQQNCGAGGGCGMIQSTCGAGGCGIQQSCGPGGCGVQQGSSFSSFPSTPIIQPVNRADGRRVTSVGNTIVPPGATGFTFSNGQINFIFGNGTSNPAVGAIQTPVGGTTGGGQTVAPPPGTAVPVPQPRPGVGETSGGAHSNGQDVTVEATRPPEATTASDKINEKYKKWEEDFKAAGNQLEKGGLNMKAGISDFTQELKNKDYKVAIFNQECASTVKDGKPATLFVFTAGEKTYFYLSNKSSAAKDKDALSKEADEAWEQAKAIGEAANNQKAIALVRDFNRSSEDPAELKDYTNTQHRIRPIVNDGKVTGFSTAQVLKHKSHLADAKWDSEPSGPTRDRNLYCKTQSQIFPEKKEDKKDDSKPKEASPALKALFKNQCVMCHDADSGRKLLLAEDGTPTLTKGLTKEDVLKAVNGTLTKENGKPVARMPEGLDELDAKQKALIEEWANEKTTKKAPKPVEPSEDETAEDKKPSTGNTFQDWLKKGGDFVDQLAKQKKAVDDARKEAEAKAKAPEKKPAVKSRSRSRRAAERKAANAPADALKPNQKEPTAVEMLKNAMVNLEKAMLEAAKKNQAAEAAKTEAERAADEPIDAELAKDEPPQKEKVPRTETIDGEKYKFR